MSIVKRMNKNISMDKSIVLLQIVVTYTLIMFIRQVGEIETTGRRSVTSLSGMRRDSEVMYVGTFGAGPQQRQPVADVFTEKENSVPVSKPALTRSVLINQQPIM